MDIPASAERLTSHEVESAPRAHGHCSVVKGQPVLYIYIVDAAEQFSDAERAGECHRIERPIAAPGVELRSTRHGDAAADDGPAKQNVLRIYNGARESQFAVIGQRAGKIDSSAAG